MRKWVKKVKKELLRELVRSLRSWILASKRMERVTVINEKRRRRLKPKDESVEKK